MNLNYLRYFLKLAEVRQYTQAAEALGITQPSLSHAVARLEQELGVPLFVREGRRILLSPYGEKLQSSAAAALDVLEDGERQIRSMAEGNGRIRLGFLRTLGTAYVPKLAAAFAKANPDREILWDFHTGVTSQLLDSLDRGDCDMVFSSEPPDKEWFDCTPVMTQDLVLIVPEGHPLSAQYTVPLKDTLTYPYIQFKEGSGLRYEIERLFRQVGQRPKVVLETEEDQVVAGLVAGGFGIALVPYMDLLMKLDVKILQISSPVCRRDIFLVTSRRRRLMPAAEKFRDFVL